MTESVKTEIETVVHESRTLRDRLAAEALNLFLNKVESAMSVEPDTLASASAAVRSELVDRILSPPFRTTVAPGVSGDRELGYLSLLFRSVAAPLVLPEAPVVREPPVRAWAYAAFFGAVAGIFTLTPLCRLLLGNRDLGLMLGGPVGALAMVLLIGFLAQRPRTVRMVQGLLGGGILLEIGSAAGLRINPLGMIWRKIRGRYPGSGFLRRLKRIGLYLTGILVLNFAVPRLKVQWDTWNKQLETALKNWIDHHAVILFLLAGLVKTVPRGEAAEPVSLPTELLGALQKLALAPEPQRASVAEEVIHAFHAAGFQSLDPVIEAAASEPLRFEPAMRESYQLIGIVQPGDPVRILEKPLIQKGKVVRRGRLTRLREHRP